METGNFRYKVTRRSGKVYISVMFWYPRSTDTRISTCSRSQINNLHDLLAKLRSDDYRKYAETVNIHKGRSIISEYIKNVNHRIDHQTTVNPDNPMLNLAYQIGDNTHAGVQIFVRPLTAPVELMTGQQEYPRIYDGNLGFDDGQVNSYFQDAIKYSAQNQCNCEIRWFVLEVEKKEDKEESEEKRKVRIGQIVAAKINGLLAASKTAESKKVDNKKVDSKKADVKAKWKRATRRATMFSLKHRPLPVHMTVIKIGAKVAVKNISKQSAKFGGKSVAKKIPFVGLAAGCLFGIFRVTQGDFLGAVMEVGSGAASLIPVYGTAVSFGIDAGLVAYDIAA